ncbi:MAG: aminotransferase class V-fold PLP-dependent enzyme [Bacteroidetes bacterium]|nr:aminotransferase class V-fold PLP-dependent enzyme [Bacteroidota bacterium]
MERRKFIKNVSLGFGALPLLGNTDFVLQEALEVPADKGALMKDEKFWKKVRKQFNVDFSVINLSNAGISPMPMPVINSLQQAEIFANKTPTVNRHVQEKEIISVKGDLSKLLGCSVEELVLLRNTTEAVNTIFWGLDLAEGDEIIIAKQDYSLVYTAAEYIASKRKLSLKILDIPSMPENDQVLVDLYKNALGPKTKLLLVTHMINWTGQILPVKEICAAAKEKGVYTLVDGAQSVAHISINLHEIDCDFFAASFHKWLCGPPGTGMLYVKKSLIGKVTPIHPGLHPYSSFIDKFETYGTHSFAAQLALKEAIRFHEKISSGLIHQRLHYLNQLWREQLKDHSQIKIYTSSDIRFSAGIVLFMHSELEPSKIVQTLRKKNILVGSALWKDINGVRISPNIYTLAEEMERLALALNEL